jgi:hypothetical protein
MMRPILAAAGMALVSACSSGNDQRVPVADDNLTRPLEVARVDTTQALAPVEHEVTRPPEPVTMPKPRKAKRVPKKAVETAETAPPPTTPEVDTIVQGYAPDTTAAPAPDTVVARTPDTASTALSDSVLVDSSVTRSPSSVQPAPPATAPAAAQTLPIGTEIHAALDDSINSRTDTAGRVVTAVVMENVTGSDGRTLIAAGAPVHFTVTRLSAAKSKSAQGRLALQVDDIAIGGELRKVSADVRPVPHELRGRGVGTSEAAKVGAGAVGGAVLGRVLGGNTKGAVIGGVAGAAGGAVVASQTASRDVVVKAKTPVVFVLTEPLVAR